MRPAPLPALVGIAAWSLAGCVGRPDPAECAADADCGPAASCISGVCHAGTRTCPVLQPRFSSIDANLFQVGCGVKSNNCHSALGASTSSALDLSRNAYDNLVGVEAANLFGSGIPCATGGECPSGVCRFDNRAGRNACKLVRVKPGDPDPNSSFLVKKLQLLSAFDPQFGSGMPADRPGSICADAQAVVAQWIAQGAQRN